VDQNIITDFLKEIAVSFRTAKSYPPGHPVMDTAINNTLEQLEIIYTEVSEFSMFFLEQTIIFQDMKIDAGKSPAILTLLNALRKIEVDSLTFASGVSLEDLKNLYEVITTPKMKIKKYGDANTMLVTKGTGKIKINVVKFGVQTSGTIAVAGMDKKSVKTKEEILEALKNLKTFVEKGLSPSETKTKLSDVVDDIEGAPQESRVAYSRAVAGIINLVPPERRLNLFQDIEMKPLMIGLLSRANDDFLVRLVTYWIEHNDQTNVNKLLRAVDEDKFTRMVPALKEKMPNIYEHLAHAGIKLLLSDKLSSVVTEDDLRMSIKPYFTMLDSQVATMRDEALRSLIVLAYRFISKGSYDIAKNIIARISTALNEEPVIEIIERLIDDISSLYQVSRKHHQKNFCTKLLEPFNTILSREGLSAEFKKKIINFMGDTGNPLGLSLLFSFLWESGIYPEVRAAIVKFGAAAVNQALVTLRDVEDYNIRMRLVDIMKNIGDKSISLLLKNLSAPEWYLRRNILTILSDIGSPDIISQIESLLNDKDHRVRLELVKTFTKLDYTEGLLKALHDTSVEVKAEALRGIRKKLNAERFVELLPRFEDTGDEVYIEVLKIIDDKTIFEATDWIKELLISLEARRDTVARDLKELGITTLVRLQPRGLKPILEELSRSKDKTLVSFAMKALERIA
jgi:hypothetical protein